MAVVEQDPARILGDRLRAVRDTRSITQEELALELDVSVRSLQDYERGEAFPRPKTRRRILTWLAEHENREVAA